MQTCSYGCRIYPECGLKSKEEAKLMAATFYRVNVSLDEPVVEFGLAIHALLNGNECRFRVVRSHSFSRLDCGGNAKHFLHFELRTAMKLNEFAQHLHNLLEDIPFSLERIPQIDLL